MTTWDDTRKWIIDAVLRGDPAAIAECYQPDAVVVAPEGRFEGRAQIEEYFRGQTEPFSDRDVTIVATHDRGEVGISEWVFAGTHTGPLAGLTPEPLPATGRRFNQRGAQVAVMVDGLIAEDRYYYDLLDGLRQLGLLETGTS